MHTRTKVALVVVSGTVMACSGSNPGTDEQTGKAASAISTGTNVDPNARFFVPAPDPAAVQQEVGLLEKGDVDDFFELAAMIGQGHAVWFNGGTPEDVETQVRKTMFEAKIESRVPVLVAYNIPYRDCSGLSAGGAADTASYEAWIDAFASGVGAGQAVVILEPDSLGIIPYNTTIYGAQDSCQPTVTDSSGKTVPAPGADPADRYAQINYAVDSIESRAPSASVYLDGTHSAWLGVGEAAYRLYTAGVGRAQGFFLNVSNYQPTDESTQFGTWVSDCITAATAGASWAAGHFGWCPSQYNPATGYGLDYRPAYAATVTASLLNMMGGAPATTHFVIDTSRNGQGAFNAAPYASPPFNQPASVISTLNAGNWCNPPTAGLGLRPSDSTGVALLDAYLWVKVPGESDGTCDIASGARGWDYTEDNPWGVSGAAENTFDPLWGVVDPVAGAWFPAAALQLAASANPPLLP